MNKLLKSALILAGVTGGFAAADAMATTSFNVVVEKIELVPDSDDINGAVTVYHPDSGIGAATTTTVDLFDTSSANLTINKPADGTYESMIVTVSTAEVSSTVATTAGDVAAALVAANNNVVTHAATTKIILGDLGAGGGADSSIDTVLGTATNVSSIPMQPITVAGTGALNLPALNLYLDQTAVDENNGATVQFDLPTITTVSSNSVDSATIPNATIAVEQAAFDAATGYVSGTSVLKAGLFTDGIPAAPLQVQSIATNGSTAVDPHRVEFLDVPEITVYPVAWLDADSDNRLDPGEFFTFIHATVANNAVVVSGTTDISVTEMLTGNGGDLDTTAIAFPPRTISITIPLAEVASTTTAEDHANAVNAISSAAGGLTGITANTFTNIGATTESSLTFAIAQDAADTAAARRTFEVITVLQSSGGDADTAVDAAEAFNFIVSGTTQFASITNVDFNTNGAIAGDMVITNVPVFGMTTFAANVEDTNANYDLTVSGQWTSDGATPTETGSDAIDDGDGAGVGDITAGGNDVAITAGTGIVTSALE